MKSKEVHSVWASYVALQVANSKTYIRTDLYLELRSFSQKLPTSDGIHLHRCTLLLIELLLLSIAVTIIVQS